MWKLPNHIVSFGEKYKFFLDAIANIFLNINVSSIFYLKNLGNLSGFEGVKAKRHDLHMQSKKFTINIFFTIKCII